MKEALEHFKPTDAAVEDALIFPNDNTRLAATFGDDSREAKIKRAKLFESSDARQQIRVHDLRATFVTLSLANGKTEAWITDRTGHKSSQTIYGYKRASYGG